MKTVSEKEALLKIYRIVFPDAPLLESEEGACYEEMKQVRDAKTLEEAMEVIRWWGWGAGSGNQHTSLRNAVKKLRREMGVHE